MAHVNPIFDLRGINHLALVAKDMAVTVDFYTQILGFPLTKTMETPDGGQHFFFDMGNGVDALAFFWWADAPLDAPGIARSDRNDGGRGRSAIGSMNHLAFDVSPEKIDEYRDRLLAKGIEVTEVVNHADSLDGGHLADWEPGDPDVFVRSIYFKDPNDFRLEFASWTREFNDDDVRHAGKTAAELTPATQSA
jgi:catechol 2,3-dioxygenase-like lactoylglutathione lyase family enzyme